MFYSDKWQMWKAYIDPKTCLTCRYNNGKIFGIDEVILPGRPPVHFRCRCHMQWLEVKLAGTATNKGVDGADWYLINYGELPDHYITKKEAYLLDWRPNEGNLNDIAPECMIGGDIFENRRGQLPEAPGRIWYEADINYEGGFRGNDRIVFSNDGLVFGTYDHYETFVEIK